MTSGTIKSCKSFIKEGTNSANHISQKKPNSLRKEPNEPYFLGRNIDADLVKK